MFKIENEKKKFFKTLIKVVFFLLVALCFWNNTKISIYNYEINFSNILLGILILFITYFLVLSNFRKSSGFIKFLFFIETFIFILVSLGFIFHFFIKDIKYLSNIFTFHFSIYYIFIIHSIIKLYIGFFSHNKKSIFTSLEFLFYIFILSTSFYLLGNDTNLVEIIRKVFSIIFLCIFCFYLILAFKQVKLFRTNKNINVNNSENNISNS